MDASGQCHRSSRADSGFPLTPARSLRAREQQRAAESSFKRACCTDSLGTILPLRKGVAVVRGNGARTLAEGVATQMR